MRITTVVGILALALLGCPPKSDNKQNAAVGPCKKVGDNCEVAPGKLGTCVSIDVCEKPPCGFACQSQH